nr:MAG TPA: hypothetical protein [Caudoviricetes sp.]
MVLILAASGAGSVLPQLFPGRSREGQRHQGNVRQVRNIIKTRSV